MKTKIEKKFTLPKGKVTVRPLIKSTILIPDVNHRAAFLAPGAKNRYVTPIQRSTGQYTNVLTKEEKDWYESPEAGMDFATGDLSIYKKENNYWDTFDILLGKEEITLDKSNPEQYLQYKVLLANTEKIASSLEEYRLKKRATYDYVLVDVEEEARMESKSADREESAWALYGELKNDRTKMLNILKVYGKRPSDTSSDDFLRTEMKGMMKKDLNGFLEIVTDPNLDTKIMITQAIKIGAVTKKGNAYFLAGGDKLAASLYDAAVFLNDPENQDVLLNIQAKIDNAGE